MRRPAPQLSTRAERRHLVLFDGECGLCASLVQFVLVRDPAGIFHFASLSSTKGRSMVARHGGDPDDVSTMFVVVDYRTALARPLARSRAALFVLRALGWPWSLLATFGLLPTALLDRLYDLVARNRHRVLRRREWCPTPRSEWQGRFIDGPEPITDLVGD
jgi:predicted DCC family thiol-disulfide oxidoreductase YuxK